MVASGYPTGYCWILQYESTWNIPLGPCGLLRTTCSWRSLAEELGRCCRIQQIRPLLGVRRT